jgi:hypothetical protein
MSLPNNSAKPTNALIYIHQVHTRFAKPTKYATVTLDGWLNYYYQLLCNFPLPLLPLRHGRVYLNCLGWLENIKNKTCSGKKKKKKT